MQENNKTSEKLINYEIAIGKFFSELGLKPIQCQLIRAFIIASNGETVFETSFRDLSEILYGNVKNSRSDNKVRYALKCLLKWQEKNNVELIRELRKGRRHTTNEGKYEFVKSKYEFVLLNEMAKLFYSNPENLEAEIRKILDEIKKQYQPMEKARKYHPKHLLRKAKKTILTKVRRVFELATEAGINPSNECQSVLNDSWEIYHQLEEDWKYKHNHSNFIAEFEKNYE